MKINPFSIFQQSFLNTKISTLRLAQAVSVRQETTVRDALHVMAEKRIGSLLITDALDQATGIFTEKDVLNKLLPEPKKCFDSPIKNFASPTLITLSENSSISRTIYEMALNGITHVVIATGASGHKIISARDIVSKIYLGISHHEKNGRLEVVTDHNAVDTFLGGDIIQVPLTKAVFVPGDKDLLVAAQEMRTNKVGCVIVSKNDVTSRGIFTTRDFLAAVADKDKELSSIQLSDVSTLSPETMLSNMTIAYAFQRICEGKFRHIPIVDAGERIKGILTVRSILKVLANNIIENLQH